MRIRFTILIVVLLLASSLQFGQYRVKAYTGARANVTGIVAKPGEKVCFNILLNYTASQPISSITYSLEVKYLPDDWEVRFYYVSTGQEIKSLTIVNKQVITIVLEVGVPKTAKPGRYAFWFLATGKEIPDEVVALELYVEVREPKRGVELSCQYPNLIVEREGTTLFHITLRNTGEVDELLSLTADAPEDWRVTFRSQTRGIFGVQIREGQAIELQAEVVLPEGVEAGTYNIRVCANSSDQVANSTLQLKVTVVKTGSVERMLSTLYPEVSVEAGRKLYFPITIRNTAESSMIFYLSTVSAPSGWSLSFRTAPSDSLSISSVFLEAGKSTVLYLEAAPPATVEIGTYDFTIKATTNEGMSEYLTTKAQVTGYYEVTLKLSTLFTRTRAGEATTITATATNTGATKLTNVTMEISLPENWQVVQTPNYIDILAPGASGSITLLIKPPSDADVGDYMIGVRCISDRAKSNQLILRVNIQSSSIFLWMIGIASIIVAAILIIAVYLKFARKT
ncbi:MAG: NEW3 domain-containing protein [Candidatus Bathyarchaeia archaeon]